MENQGIECIFKISNQSIFLRDMSIKDIDDYIIWNTTEFEWQDWDAPWEKEEINIENIKNGILQKLKNPVPEIRRRLEICTIAGQHIGWVTSYNIDGDKTRFAVGIDIPCREYRGKNLGEMTLTLFISYWLKSNTVSEIYTQTWSGNHRMISLVEKCGFEIVCRNVNYREVRGSIYDSLTFKLNKDLFWERFKYLK